MIWAKIIRPTVIVIALTGCLEDVSYPDEPQIEYLSFDVNENGSAVLSLNVTDGDGDLGLNPDDIEPPFCVGCDHYYNLKCEYDELRDGVWTHIELNPDEDKQVSKQLVQALKLRLTPCREAEFPHCIAHGYHVSLD